MKRLSFQATEIVQILWSHWRDLKCAKGCDKYVSVQITVFGGQAVTPVQVELFRDSHRACKLSPCSFQDDHYRQLQGTDQLGSDSGWAKSFWEHSWEPLVLWRDSSERQHWGWDACPDCKLCRNFCTADKLCPGPCEEYMFCENTYRLYEASLGCTAAVSSVPAAPSCHVGHTQIWMCVFGCVNYRRNCLLFPTLPPHPMHPPLPF